MTTESMTFADQMRPENIGAHTSSSLALALWREQLAAGLGDPGEVADDAGLPDWLANRTYPLSRLDDAIRGDVSAIVEVRTEAGLPVFS